MDDVVVVEAAHDLHDRVDFADIGKKFVPEALAFGRSRDEPGNVHELDDGGNDDVRLRDFRQRREAFVRHFDDADVRLDRAERIIGRLRLAGTRQRVEKRALPDVGKPYDASLKHF